MALCRQIPRAPGATGARFRDKNQVFGFGVPLADELSNVTWAGADGPAGGDLSAVRFRDGCYGHRVLVDIQSEVKRARLAHG
jgi:hypothetical protein